MVPDEWEKSSIGELSTYVTSGSRGWAKYYSDEGYKFFRITNLRRDKIIPDETDMKYVSLPIGMNEGTRTSLEKGDLLISITADLGIIGYIEDDEPEPRYINQHVSLVRPKHTKIDSKFLAYLLASYPYEKLIKRMNDAGAKAGLNLSTIRSVPVKYPSREEQTQIVEILSTWDQAIEATEKLIANSYAQKKALMQQLLTGKKRLPGFSGEWETIKLSEAFEILTAPSKTKSIDEKGSSLIVDMGAIDRSSQLVAHKTVVDRVHPLKKGDLVMPKDDIGGGQIIGRVALIPDSETFELGDHVYALRCKTSALDSTFAYYRINEFNVRKSLRRKANGTAQLGLGKKEVLKQAITIPTLEEQKAISGVLLNCDKTHFSLCRKLDRLKLEKTALMQQLLTGKRRVKTGGKVQDAKLAS